MKFEYKLTEIGWAKVLLEINEKRFYSEPSYISEPLIDLLEEILSIIPGCVPDDELKTVDNFNSMELDTTRYLKDSGELVVEYDGELTGDDYEVIYYDHSNSMNVYGNDMFEVDVK